MILPLIEMAKRVLEKADLNATDHTIQLNKVKDWINDVYVRISRLYLWPELLRTTTLTLEASTTDYALNSDIDDILKVTDVTNGTNIRELSEDEFREFLAPYQLVTTGKTVSTPIGYRQTKVLSCKQMMSTSDTVRVYSSNANDVAPNAVRISGLVSGVELAESVTLNGTTPVTSTLTYDANTSLNISVSTTDGSDKTILGYISVTETTDASKVKTIIKPNEFASQYQWISVFPTPPASGTLPTWSFLYKKRIQQLQNVMDMPELDCSLELMQGAYVELLKNDNDARYTTEAQIFSNMVQELIRDSSKTENYHFQFRGRNKNNHTWHSFMGSTPYSGVL